MLVAKDAKRLVKCALVGAKAHLRQPGTQTIDGHAARTGSFTCCQCDAPVTYFRAYTRKDGTPVLAHWRHARHSSTCSMDDGGEAEGAWHRMVKEALFPLNFYEWVTDDGLARADVLVESGAKSNTLMAVEVQHSHIHPVTVQDRMVSHRAAGWRTTWWMIGREHLSAKGEGTNGAPTGIFTTAIPWVMDLLSTVRHTPHSDPDEPGQHRSGYAASAWILSGEGEGIRARQVEAIQTICDEQGNEMMRVKIGPPHEGADIRRWASRPTGDPVPAEGKAAYQKIEAASQRRIKPLATKV